MELAEWAVIGCAADHERGEARRFLRHPSVLNLALEAGEQAAEAVVRTAAEDSKDGDSSGDSDRDDSDGESTGTSVSAYAASEDYELADDLDGLELDGSDDGYDDY